MPLLPSYRPSSDNRRGRREAWMTMTAALPRVIKEEDREDDRGVWLFHPTTPPERGRIGLL